MCVLCSVSYIIRNIAQTQSRCVSVGIFCDVFFPFFIDIAQAINANIIACGFCEKLYRVSLRSSARNQILYGFC